MFSIQTAPAKQSVSDTISVLSGRLGSATLLEDRRAAILGLRSFAKDFPASVSSGALRSLIGSLSKDGEDVDTVKVVLETLLMLFNPNEDSPEASDEIALWLADEFTQRQENITLLLNFLEANEFHSRLYTLQLLAAILSARTERTEECIFTAPLGISRLVAILDDPREAVRNEAVILLTYLTAHSIDIQKLVAFENAFDRIFAIVDADGALVEGGRTVEDCLILLANLLRRNASNQSLFRESACINRLADLLAQLLRVQIQEADIADWAQVQRNRNLYAFLAVVRLFLINGSKGTSHNQDAFWKHGLSNNVLQLAFSHDTETPIKAEALTTNGDMIRGNSALQEVFAQLLVTSPLVNPETSNGQANGNGEHAKVYVIDGLLDLVLNFRESSAFDVRFAACECLKAYFSGHEDVRLHFLGRAIEGHQADRDESANILTVILTPTDNTSNSDPYRHWFAAVIAFHLLFDNTNAKVKAQSLTEGDASKGEEVVTSIQTVSAHLIAGLRRQDDPRIVVGNLMLLLGWLFEDLDAVNDFLSEGSNVQSLVQVVSQPGHDGDELVQGLCAMLLGVVYEFATKDSPVPRATLHSILTSRLDRDRYLDRLAKLRSNPLIRDYEVTPQKLSASPVGSLPEVFFDAVFVDFLKDNYSRIARAIDRKPELEISVITNGVQKGISRELVDSLRTQLEESGRLLNDTRGEVESLEARLGQEKAEHRRSKEEAANEASKVQNAEEGRQRAHEAELRKLQSQLSAKDADYGKNAERMQAQLAEKDAEREKQLAKLRKTTEADHGKHVKRLEEQLAEKVAEHGKELAKVRKEAEAEAERVQRRSEAEVADLRATISRLEVELMKANKSKAQELQALQEEQRKLAAEQTTKAEQAERQCRDLEVQLESAHTTTDELRQNAAKDASALKEMDATKATTQSELDDLLIVFGDLEDKVDKYKRRLRELGDEVSDGEEDGDGNDSSDDNDDVD